MLIRLASSALAAGIVTTLLAASPIEATARSNGVATSAGASVARGAEQAGQTELLTPRARTVKPASHEIELPEDPRTGARYWTGRLIVKFRDDLKMRADAMPGRPVRGATLASAQRVNDVAQGMSATLRPYFAKSPSKLRSIEQRAERYSKAAQPDLAGMVFVDVMPERLLETARAFNGMDEVEWVYIEREPRPCGEEANLATQDGCGTNGPGDSTGYVNCFTASQGFGGQDRCSTLGGGGGCNNPNACNADGGPTPACRYGCNDDVCCETVAALQPTCADRENGRGWDAICATYANLLCNSTRYDTNAATQGGVASAAIPFAAAVPASYKYDPCFAMRAPPVQPPASAVPGDLQQVMIQGTVFTVPNLIPADPLDPNPNLASQLLTYEFCTGDSCPAGTVDPTTVERIVYNPSNPSVAPSLAAEGIPTSGVAFQAKPDPSLENAQLSISGDCLNAGGQRGCSLTTCCVAVCRVDPLCCTVGWDQPCADRAKSESFSDSIVNPTAPCVSGELSATTFPRSPASTTPDFTGSIDPTAVGQGGGARGYQLFTVGQPVLGQFEFLPTGLNPPPIPPPTVNAPTVTDNAALGGTLAFLNSNYRGGGLDMEAYFTVANELEPGINPDEIRGQGIKVAVVDRSAYVLHEDLVNRVTTEQGQTQILISTSVPGYGLNPDHGTGVLGIIGAEEGNGIGITGIAYAADLFFFPAVSVEEGQRLQNAMVSALLELREGDVLCVPMDLPGVQGVGLTLASAEPYFLLMQTATAAGITVVIPAGNEASPVVTSPATQQETPDSGAIVVGACWPGTQVGFLTSQNTTPNLLPGNGYCRFRTSNFSNIETAGGGNTVNNNRVHVAAWGTGCVTTGFGGLFQGENPAPTSTDIGNQANKLRTYSSPNQFTGTSPATAMIAGWAACLQSLLINTESIMRPPLPPTVLRREISRYPTLSDPSGSVRAQCGFAYAPGQSGYPDPPGPPALFGDTCVVDGSACALAPVGGFPLTRATVGNIIAETVGGSTPQITVVTGVLQGGNAFSLVEVDGAVLNLGAARRRAGNSGQAFGPALLYPLTGGTTDVQLLRTERVRPESVSSLQLLTSARISSAVPVVQLVYFYNFNQGRWAIAGSTFLSQAAGAATFQPIGFLGDYVSATAGGGCQFLARVYTCALGPGGYNVLHDQAVFVPTFDIFNP